MRSFWEPSHDLADLGRGLMLSRSFSDLEYMTSRSSDKVRAITKAAVSAETLTANPGFSDLSAAFVASLAQSSVLDRIAADGSAVPMPYSATAANVALGTIASYSVGEGLPKPISGFTFAGTVTRGKCSTIVVCAEELLKSAAAVAMLDAELRRSIAAGSNGAFLAALMAAGDTIAAGGATAAQIATTIAAAVQLIGTSERSRFYLAVSPSTQVQLALTTDTAGALAFPDLTVTGGELAGITVMASDSLETSPPHAVLFDASRLGVGDAGVKLDQARHASLEMVDNPASNSSASHNLWQRNERGLRAERAFSLAFAGDTSSSAPVVSITSAW